jgi:hypothetical protein
MHSAGSGIANVNAHIVPDRLLYLETPFVDCGLFCIVLEPLDIPTRRHEILLSEQSIRKARHTPLCDVAYQIKRRRGQESIEKFSGIDLIVENAGAGTDRGCAAAGRIPGEPQTRRKIPQ